MGGGYFNVKMVHTLLASIESNHECCNTKIIKAKRNAGLVIVIVIHYWLALKVIMNVLY